MFPQARTENVLFQEIGDELIVYDQESHRAHRLNVSAALVWKHCNGQTSVSELSALLQSRLGLPPDEEIACLALDRLEKAHLLQEPVEGSGLSRRKLLQKLGLVGGLSLLLPTVISIVAPTPATAIGYSTVFCCTYFSQNGPAKPPSCDTSGAPCPPAGRGEGVAVHTARFCDEC
jgi:Coenzyme PQQ synthesis protein D (PqqD)